MFWFYALGFRLFISCHPVEKKEAPDFLAEKIDTAINVIR